MPTVGVSTSSCSRPHLAIHAHASSYAEGYRRPGLLRHRGEHRIRPDARRHQFHALAAPQPPSPLARRQRLHDNLEVRLDLLNAFNRHYLADPVTDIGSPDFGYVTGLAPASNFGTGSSLSRQVQIGVRVEF